jgi:uncharacterized protein YbbK (DUF523 family)
MHILVSACLIGENCRYNGQTKKNDAVLAHLHHHTYTAFCPEAILGTPREAMHCHYENDQLFLKQNNNQEDLTETVLNYCNLFLSEPTMFDKAILKARSPSCGIGSTPYYNNKGELLHYCDGLFAKMIRQLTIPMHDEEHIND